MCDSWEIDHRYDRYGQVEEIVTEETEGRAFTRPRGSPVLAYLRDHGYTRLAVMESCTSRNFTRLAFKVTGYDEWADRRAGHAGDGRDGGAGVRRWYRFRRNESHTLVAVDAARCDPNNV
jgi:hypothetical protein